MPMLGSLFTGLMSTIGGFLTTAISGIISGLGAILAPLASVLLPLIAVVGGIYLAAKGLGKLYEFVTGKSVESKAAYDKKTTPKQMQEDIIWSETSYNEGAYKRDKEELSKSNIKPGRKKDLEERTARHEKVQEFKKTDSFQQWKKEEQSKPSEIGGKPGTYTGATGDNQAVTTNKAAQTAITGEDNEFKNTATKINPTEAKSSNYKTYLAEELKKAGNSRIAKDNAYDKARMRASADQMVDQLDDQEAQQMIDDAKTSGALQDPGKEKQLSRLNEATTTNQNLATTPSSTIVPVVNNTNNIVSGGGGGGGGVPMGVRNEEPILMQVQYGKVRPV
jgi:hypothetical protein